MPCFHKINYFYQRKIQTQEMVGLITGIIASMAHVITGPDHLAAVTPFAIDSRKKSWIIGFSWGIGHTFGMLIIGGIFVLLRGYLPMDKITSHSEILVGIMLIIIGFWAIRKTLKENTLYFHHHHPHVHHHSRFLERIFHHSHPDREGIPEHEDRHHENSWAAFVVGTVHGVTGINHLVAILPVLALATIWDGIFYLTGFAAGTIFTMVFVALVLGIIAHRSSQKNKTKFLFWFSMCGGLLATITGIYWILISI